MRKSFESLTIPTLLRGGPRISRPSRGGGVAACIAREGSPLTIGNRSVTNGAVDPFAALADPVRRALVVRLAGGPARVVDLAAEHPISRPAISKHLRLLTEARLATAEDRGRERHYRLDRTGLGPVRELLDALAPTPPISERDLDGLDLEVRRAGRDRRAAGSAPTEKEESA